MDNLNTNQRNTNFSKSLLNWFTQNKRDLPFRRQKDPYKIWISEIMAQQTQIDTLLPYYEAFITAFPTVDALAAASESEVIKHWEGLGYYSRARNLHKAAGIIADQYNGVFPEDYAAILKLPGIGPYTAGAIASIAFGAPVPAIDGNVMRVVTRFCNWPIDTASGSAKKEIGAWVLLQMPKTSPGDYNEALMELGALVCTPKSPACLLCPLNALCQSRAAGTTGSLPVKSKKIHSKPIAVEVAMITNAQGNLYLKKRPSKGLLANLWGFPVCVSTPCPGEAITREITVTFPQANPPVLLGKSKHVFSHRTWNMTIYHFSLRDDIVMESPQNESATFASSEAITRHYALPVAFSKLLPFLFPDQK